MSLEGKKDQVTGKAKEVAGKVTDNKKLEAEGKAEGLLGKAKDVAANLKNKAKDSLDKK